MSTLQLRPIKHQHKVYRQALTQIVELIRSGALRPGDRLPSEIELARMLEVSRPSVREALRALELLGAIECRTGSGNYVSDGSADAWSDELIGELLIVGSPQEVQDARWYIEVGTAELCARHRTDEDLEKLRLSVERFEAAFRTGTGASEEGLEFHQLVARASHNAVLTMAIDLIMERMRKPVWQHYEHALCADPVHVHLHIEQHRAIYEAVARQDARQAVRAMRAHLRCLDADLRGKAGSAVAPRERKEV